MTLTMIMISMIRVSMTVILPIWQTHRILVRTKITLVTAATNAELKTLQILKVENVMHQSRSLGSKRL